MLNLILRRLLPVVAVSLLVVILATSWVGTKLETQELAYVSELQSQTGERQIRLMDIERGLTAPLTNPGFGISSKLRWTSDGGNLIFAAFEGGNHEIYRMNVTTRDLSSLAKFIDSNQLTVYEIVLSPDGQHIAILQTDYWEDQQQLYLMDVQSSELRQLTTDHSIASSSLNWSPDSQQLIYTTFNDNGLRALWLLDINRAEPESIPLVSAENSMNVLIAHWLAVDQISMYARDIPFNASLPIRFLVMNVKTDEINEISDLEFRESIFMGDFTVAWSDDGSKTGYAIATPIVGQPDLNLDIVVQDIRNIETRQVIDLQSEAMVGDLELSLDESLLAFTVNSQDSATYLLIVRVADGQIIQSTKLTDHHNCREYAPAWRP